MKKFVGAILIILGILLAIPAGLRLMYLAGYFVQVMFDPEGGAKSASINSIIITGVLVTGMILFFSYGSKLWKDKKKEENTNDIS